MLVPNSEEMCVNINECLGNPCVNGECIDRDRGFECHCFAGYSGIHCKEKQEAYTAYVSHGFIIAIVICVLVVLCKFILYYICAMFLFFRKVLFYSYRRDKTDKTCKLLPYIRWNGSPGVLQLIVFSTQDTWDFFVYDFLHFYTFTNNKPFHTVFHSV